MTMHGHSDSSDFPSVEGFEVLEKLGAGAMGAVYHAKKTSLNLTVALRVLPASIESDTSYTESFLNEARAASHLNHPNITRVISAGRVEGLHFFVMELIAGDTLAAIVKREGALPEESVVSIGICIADALKHAWDAAQLIHRNIRPENVMVDAEGNVKLCDLGLSRNFSEQTMRSLGGKLHAAAQYLAPEQARGEPIDCRADIYATGMTLYFTLTGKVPFDGNSPAVVMARQLTEKLPDPRDAAGAVSGRLCRVLEKMLAKNADDRYASWDEVLADLERVRDGLPPQFATPLAGPSSMAFRDESSKPVEVVASFAPPVATPAPVSPRRINVPPPLMAPATSQPPPVAFVPSPPPPQVVAQPMRTAATQPRVRKKSLVPMFVMIGVGLFVLLAAGLGGALYFFSRKPDFGSALNNLGNNPPPDPIKSLASAHAFVEEEVPTNESIPFDTLERVKSSTVFLQCAGLRTRAVGSGFVMLADGDTRYIVTNDHVVTDEDTGRIYTSITAIFWSGTKQERSAPAQVVAADPNSDLAVIKVVGSGLPQALDLSRRPKLMETMPVFIFGFPHGDKLAVKHGNPEVSVGKAAVSSIRRDDFGEVAQVQIDGAMNPGNSGGPVVNANGRLVGVSVATIRGAGIGFAIPSTELAKVLLGRVSGFALASRAGRDGATEVAVVAGLIDPLNRMKSVAVIYSQENPTHALKPDDKGRWLEMPNGKSVTLTIDQQRARGTFHVPVAQGNLGLLWVQGSFVDGDGVAHYSKPEQVRVDTRGVPMLSGRLPPPQPGGGGQPPRGGGLPPSLPGTPDEDVPVGSVALTFIGAGGAVFTPDGRKIFSAQDNTVKLWDADSSRTIVDFKGHDRGVEPQVAVSADGKFGLSGGADNVARFWDLSSGQELRVLRGHTGLVRGVALSGDGKLAASASDDGTARIWNAVNGAEQRALRGHGGEVKSVVFLPDNRHVLTASWDKTLRLWDATTGNLVRAFSGHASGIVAVAVSPDGKFALSAGYDKVAKLWNVATGQETRTLRGHVAPLQAVAFSADGRHVVTGSSDGVLKIWSANSGAEIRTLQVKAGVITLQFSPDGKHLLSGHSDKIARLWKVF